jgi:hypothetical protein
MKEECKLDKDVMPDHLIADEGQAGQKTDQNCDRPESGCVDLFAAFQRIAGTGNFFYFGTKWEKSICDAHSGEVASLSGEHEAPPPPECSPNFTGGEHDVWIGEPPATVIKHTLDGFYGRTIDEKELLDPHRWVTHSQLYLRNALPSEYFLRWHIAETVFGLPTNYLGRNGLSPPKIAISQPFIDQDPEDQATETDVFNFMAAHGFEKVAAESIAVPEIANVTWYRQTDGILISDAHPRNFRKDENTGTLIPVDLMLTVVPKGTSKILPDPKKSWTFSSESNSSGFPKPI